MTRWMLVALLASVGGAQQSFSASTELPLPAATKGWGSFLTWKVPPEVFYDTAELVKKWGYPVEKHIAVTEDGYKLGLFRIPGSSKSPPRPQKPVVFLQHGLTQCTDQWVLRGPEEDLVFLLADRGYDVWMGNFRGNMYSRGHVNITTRNPKFWRYSWHENGVYDLAASIRLALNVARVASLLYIGHSMGTSTNMVLLSERTEFNRMIRAAFLLAPVGNLREAKGAVTLGLALAPVLEQNFQAYDAHGSFLPHSNIFSRFLYHWCKPAKNDVCLNLFYAVAGRSPKQLNQTVFPLLMSHIPCGSSIGQFRLYLQSFMNGELRHFDYGSQENIRRYGAVEPPAYRLDRITTPVHLFYSKGDYLASAADAIYLARFIPNVTLHKVPFDDFSHADFLWGVDTYRLLYKELLTVMDQY